MPRRDPLAREREETRSLKHLNHEGMIELCDASKRGRGLTFGMAAGAWLFLCLGLGAWGQAGAQNGLAGVRAADSPTTPGVASNGKKPKKGMEGEGIDLGVFGQNFKWIVSPLRENTDTSEFVFDVDTGEIVGIVFAGLIQIYNEQMRLDCEYLTYDGSDQKLTARYNVTLDYSMYELKANCGQLTYDRATEEITLTVNPEVSYRGSSIRDQNEIVITRSATGRISLRTKSGTTGNFVGAPEATATPVAKSNDRSTTGPTEITPGIGRNGGAIRPPQSTPTPRPRTP